MACYDFASVLSIRQKVPARSVKERWNSQLRGVCRQASFTRSNDSWDYAVFTQHADGEYLVEQVDRQGNVINQMDQVRTAVYNTDGKTIIVGQEFDLRLLGASDFDTKLVF